MPVKEVPMPVAFVVAAPTLVSGGITLADVAFWLTAAGSVLSAVQRVKDAVDRLAERDV